MFTTTKLRPLVALALAVGLLLSPALAAGETWDGEEPGSRTRSIPIEYLGYASTPVLTTGDPSTEFAIPRSVTTTARRFTTTIQVPDYLQSAELLIEVDGSQRDRRWISGGTTAYIEVALRAGDTTLTITARWTALGSCTEVPSSTIAIVRSAAFGVDRTDTRPTSLRDAIPEAALAVEFVVADDRSADVDQAVLAATTVLAREYPGMQSFSVLTSAPTTSTPFTIPVWIQDHPEAGISVEDGAVHVRGTGPDLLDQVAALDVSTLRTFGGTRIQADADASIQMPESVALEAGTRVPIDEIANSLRAEGAHHLRLAIPLDQTSYREPVSSYRLRLGGLVIPAPAAGHTTGQLSLWIQDELTTSIEIAPDGRFDLDFTIEASEVLRESSVSLVLDSTIDCEQAGAISLQIDTNSWVEATAGQALQPSFARFPQVLASDFPIYAGRTTGDLAVAVDVAAMLQEHSQRPLNPRSIGWSAVAVEPAATVVIQPDDDLIELLGAPVNVERGIVHRPGVELRVVDDSAGSSTFQAFATEGRDLLMVNVPAEKTTGLPEATGRNWHRFSGSWSTLDPTGQVVNVAAAVEFAEPEVELLASISAGDQPRGRQRFAQGLGATLMIAAVLMVGLRLKRSIAEK